MSTMTRNPADFMWARLWIVCQDCKDEMVIEDTILQDVPTVFYDHSDTTGFPALDDCLEGGWSVDEYGDWHCFRCNGEGED